MPDKREAPTVRDVDKMANEVESAVFSMLDVRDRVSIMLLFNQHIREEHIEAAWTQWQQEGGNAGQSALWRYLMHIDEIDRQRIFAEAAWIYGFEEEELDKATVVPFLRQVKDMFEESDWKKLIDLRVIPVRWEPNLRTSQMNLVLTTHDPGRPGIQLLLRKIGLKHFELRYTSEIIIDSIISETFPRKNEFLERMDENSAFDLGMSYEADDKTLVDEGALEAEISRSTLINRFEATLVEAVRLGVSDVHIWPNAKKQIEIHFRIDGRLQRWHVEDRVHPEALIAVIKDNAVNVDRFERDAAQDGFIQRKIDDTLIRFRVSVMPIANAASEVRSESIVIRVLDDRKVVKDLSMLGLEQRAMERFHKAIHQPHGMVILTGPTGSGKTTTLYAALHEVVSPHVNVLTVEDPVEYLLPGVRQIKLNHKLALEGALRNILRHDPDVVMVGEMRDKATAELAIKLANTGHLTFSTLHTNDAASAVTRLYKMGIEAFLIAYAINLVVAQRLIRKLCDECKCIDDDRDTLLLQNVGFTPKEIAATNFYVAGSDQNCSTCKGRGYKGRRAVSEALYFSKAIRQMIADAAEGGLDEMAIRDKAIEEGMMTLQDSAREVVKTGETSIRELLRVVSTE